MNRLVQAARFRHEMFGRVRKFFDRRDLTEVRTALVSASGVTDVHVTGVQLADGRYLRTSPEYTHKQLLAEGVGDLWELGAVFRAGEHGRLHREEFLMLEWYRVGWHWRDLAAEVIDLMRDLDHDDRLPDTVVYRSWRELARETLGFDPLAASAELPAALREAPDGLDFPEQLDWLFSIHMQPALAGRGIVVVHDFPACQAALARLDPGNAEIAQRFEVMVDGIELANGYQELTDAEEQAARFAEDNRRRKKLGLPAMQADDELLEALRRGLPDCAGVALGFDRLLMLLAGVSDIGQTRLNDQARS